MTTRIRSGQKSGLSAVISCDASLETSQLKRRCESAGNLATLSVEAPSAQEQEVLRSLDFFQDLEAHTQTNLLHLVKVVTKRRGTVLFCEGDSAECCFIVLSGQVSLSKMERPCSAKTDSLSGCSTCTSSHKTSRCSSRSSSSAPSRAITPSGQRAQVDVIHRAVTKLALAAEEEATAGRDVMFLKAGRLFGDVTLLHRTSQSFTATCAQDCELFVIEKSTFEQVLRQDVQRLTDKKLGFLKKYLPGAKDLPLDMSESLLQCFQKKHVPKGRVILNQNAMAKKCLYLVSSGSVFLSCNDVEMPVMPDNVRTLGSLLRGGIFGSMEERPAQPCTVYCTSSCELFYASGRSLGALASSIRRCVQKYLSQTAEWRLDDVGQLHDAFGQSASESVQQRPRRASDPQGASKPGQLRRRASCSHAMGAGRETVHRWLDTTNSSGRTIAKRSLGTSSLPSLPR